MFFEAVESLYSDTLIPDIFITEYMPSMDSDAVKVYLYCVFMCKHNKSSQTKDIAKSLGIDSVRVKDILLYLESLGIIHRTENTIFIEDLKKKEISKTYRLKMSSTPEEALENSRKNKRRNSIIASINNTFFQGLMPPSWYTDIDAWFDRFKFDEDVMLALFQYCYDKEALNNKNYIVKVAESWYSKGIKNCIDLDNYYIEYQKYKDIKSKIIKKLGLARNLTEYESEYVQKWVIEYKYSFEIIELALKKTTAKSNPNFRYIHAILHHWHTSNLLTKEDIVNYEKVRKSEIKKTKPSSTSSLPQHENFDQRQYNDEYFKSLYSNIEKGS